MCCFEEEEEVRERIVACSENSWLDLTKQHLKDFRHIYIRDFQDRVY
jgi:hypothetical protein